MYEKMERVDSRLAPKYSQTVEEELYGIDGWLWIQIVPKTWAKKLIQDSYDKKNRTNPKKGRK